MQKGRRRCFVDVFLLSYNITAGGETDRQTEVYCDSNIFIILYSYAMAAVDSPMLAQKPQKRLVEMGLAGHWNVHLGNGKKERWRRVI